jgi:hypothetical protein
MIDYGVAITRSVSEFKKSNETSMSDAVNMYTMKQGEMDMEFLGLVFGIINCCLQSGNIEKNQQLALENLVIKEFVMNLDGILKQQIDYLYNINV